MKKLIVLLVILLPLAVAAPGHCFFDWLFSGGGSRDAIDNSALGDLRSWWTGNPGYVFNPWWSGPSNPQAQGSSGASYGPQAPYPQMPQPNISYSPPQGQPPAGYGQPMQQPMPQAMQPGYGGGMAAAGQQYQMPAQGYQPMPQYQPTPQYQTAPQTYQPPQGYQAAPQMMQQPVPQGYPGVAGAPQMGPQGNYRQ